MKRFATAVAALLLTTAAHAQIYQWKDESGKTVMSDKPPIGGPRLQRKNETDVPTPAAITAAPQKTTADREMDFRKRQKEAQKKTETAQNERTDAADNKENCTKARQYLESLQSGERIALRDDKGERYFMEDAQRQQEIAKAQQAVKSSCK